MPATTTKSAADVLASWPEESREAAQLVLDTYGDPDELTDSEFVWHGAGPWKRIVATKVYFEHAFPTKHIDSVESFINYRVRSRSSAISLHSTGP